MCVLCMCVCVCVLCLYTLACVCFTYMQQQHTKKNKPKPSVKYLVASVHDQAADKPKEYVIKFTIRCLLFFCVFLCFCGYFRFFFCIANIFLAVALTHTHTHTYTHTYKNKQQT